MKPELPAVHYAIVRKDLPLGSQVAQVIHAAGESATLWGGPLPEGTHAVALHARDEAHLCAIAARLTEKGIEHILIEECECGPQSTAGFAGTATAIGIKPILLSDRARVFRWVSDLPLVR